jgi:hypothetical protein
MGTPRLPSGGRTLRPRKASHAAACGALEQLPNIGPSLAADLRRLGIQHPQELASRDAFALYQALCVLNGRRQDPCVLDTFLAAVDFMRGAAPRPWWTYTAGRKATYAAV